MYIQIAIRLLGAVPAIGLHRFSELPGLVKPIFLVVLMQYTALTVEQGDETSEMKIEVISLGFLENQGHSY